MKRHPSLSPVLALVLGILFISAPVASAQAVTSSLPGITVTGVGTAFAPAETATVVISLGSDPYMYADGPAMGQTPAQSSIPIVTADDIAQPIIDVLVAAGLPANEIEVISNPYAGGYGPYGAPLNVMISFELTNPTVDDITALLDPALEAAASARLFINMTSVVYGIADCTTLQQQARDNAVADARDIAGLQATALSVTLGDVVASRDNPYALSGGPYYGVIPVNSCTLGAPDPKMVSMYGGPAFDPMMPAEVVIQTSIEVTFEIEPAMNATPAT